MHFFDSLGHILISNVVGAGRAVLLFLQSALTLRMLGRSLRQLIRQLESAGFGSILVLSLIAALTGMIMVLQMGPSMETYGALSMLGGIIGTTFTRELGPIWAAVIVLARVGSAIAAELGTMVVNDEVEALKVMGVEPKRYLVMPRILALVLAMPILTIIADVVGLYGGAFVAWSRFGQPNETFFTSAQMFLDWKAVTGGLIKSVVFGIIIGTIACDQGLNARGGAEGVGKVTTSTVRLCVIFVLIADLIMTGVLDRMWPVPQPVT